MRRAAKRDDNEALIVTALQSAGWTVVRVSDTGVPDLLCARDGKVSLLEVKAADGALTKAQEETFTRLAKAGVLVQVVRSPQEALLVAGAPGVLQWDVKPATRRWLAENGAFLCESCWLPEDGLHAKDCPNRTRLKPKPSVQSAYRAAKKMEEAMPKRVEEAILKFEMASKDYFSKPHPHPALHEGLPRGVEGELQPLKVKR